MPKIAFGYPPQSIEFKTDVNGLVSLQDQAGGSKRLLVFSQRSRIRNLSLSTQRSAEPAATASDAMAAQDQIWSEELAKSSLAYGLLLFFGLGILLAFTPCSLPMLPILTSLIIRDSKGLKSMDDCLGLCVQYGHGLCHFGFGGLICRFELPALVTTAIHLIAFSILFVLFALNLFGLFELKLPQAVVNKLDHIQVYAKGWKPDQCCDYGHDLCAVGWTVYDGTFGRRFTRLFHKHKASGKVHFCCSP